MCCNTPILQAQNPYAIHYTTEDGLPSNTIYGSLQASNGVLFFGTDDGLVSFDGVQFRTYRNSESKNYNISNLLEDEKGRIWGHNFANQLFYFERDSLYLDTIWSNKASFVIESMGLYKNKLYLNSTTINNIILGCSYDLEAKTIHQMPMRYSTHVNNLLLFDGKSAYIKNDTNTKEIFCPLCFYTKGNDWHAKTYRFQVLNEEKFYFYQNLFNENFYNANGLITELTSIPFVFQLIGDTLHPKYFPTELEKYGISINIENLYSNVDGRVWVVTSEGLFLWDMEQNTVEHYFPKYYISSMVIDKERGIWITTSEKGLFYIEDDSVFEYSKSEDNRGVTRLVGDHEGANLLLGYRNGDVEYINTDRDSSLIYIESDKKGAIFMMKVDNSSSNYFYGSRNGTFEFDARTFESIPINLTSNEDLTRYRENIFYTSFIGGGICSQKQQQRPDLPKSWLEDIDTTIDIGYGAHREWKYNLSPEHVRGYAVLAQLKQDSLEAVWLATADGVICIKARQEYIHLKDENGEKIIAKDLLLEKGDTFWIGSQSGLYQVIDYQIVNHYTKKDGLLSNKVFNIKWYKGELWGLMEEGMFRLNSNNNLIECYSHKNNTLPIREICDFDFTNDKLFLTNKASLVAIELPIKKRPSEKYIHLRHLSVNDSIIWSFENSERTIFNHNQNNIRFEFRGIAHSFQDNFRYKYRLTGLERSWNFNNSNRNSVNYPELSGGEYQFEIMIITPDGEESKRIVYPFKIKKSYYRQWWFYGLVIFLGAGLLWLQFKYRLRKIEEETKKEIQSVQLQQALRLSELKAIKAQLNPHFIFNALNSIQQYILTNNREIASEYLGKFADLMRIYLNHSQQKTVSLEEELEALELYLELEAIRFDKDFDYKIHFSDEVEEDLEIPVMLLQPYVENAIRHGLFYKKGIKQLIIEVEYGEKQDLLIIKIEDNGVGRAESALRNRKRSSKHKSFATSANQTRLDLINYERTRKIRLDIVDLKQPTGTVVLLYIPI